MAVVVTSASPDVVSPVVFTVLSGTFPLIEGPAFRVIAVDEALSETDMGLHTTYDGATIAVIYAGPLAAGAYTFRVEEDGNPTNNSSVAVTVVDGSVTGVTPASVDEGGGTVVVEGTFEAATDYYARLDPGAISLSGGDPVQVADGVLTFTVPAGVAVGSYTITVSTYVGLELTDLPDPQDFAITSGGGGGGAGPGGGCAVDQMMLIRDSGIVGAVISATSEDGARVGLVVPAAANQGSVAPTVTGDPDDLTIDAIALQIVGGGSIGAAGRGSAEWVWEDAENSVWAGANSEGYAWGHHLPLATNRLGAVVVYSSVFRRVVVIAANHSGGVPTGVITSAWVGSNARPTTVWSDKATFTPSGGVADGGHALAACEAPDGALLLAVKKPVLGTASDAFETGDWDMYRSEDGGESWTLSRKDILQAANASGSASNGCARIAASGNWIRLAYVEHLSGSIACVVSADLGATWKALDSLVAATDIAGPLTDQDHDVRPFDIVAVDESTGAFLLTTDPVGSGASNRIKFWSASRDSQWEGTAIAGSQSLPDTVRSFVLYRDPCWVWAWVAVGDPGSSTGRWAVLRAPRDLVLEPTEWVSMANPHHRRGATRLLPIQARAVWCGDRTALLGYLEDIAETPPVGRMEARPWLCWIGGWSSRPWGSNLERADGLLESLHWDMTQGEPALGATSLTMSEWTHAISGGGTHTWEGGHVLYSVSTTSEFSLSSINVDVSQQQSPPQWDPDLSDEAGAVASRIFACEWVCAVGTTASSLGSNAGVRVWMPDTAGSGAAYRLVVRIGTTNAIVYDEVGTAPVAVLAVDATSLADDIWHRFRLTVAPAATVTGAPQGVLQHRRDDGDLWSEVAFDLPATGGAAVTMARFDKGMLNRSSPGGYAEVGFRDFRVSSYWFRPNYSDFTAPGDLPGARAALRMRGLTTGSTASDPSLLQVSWGGAGAFVGDSWSHVLSHDYAAEMVGVDSPRFFWRSGSGSTAGQAVVYDACRGAAVDDGRRFVHSHSAIFGLNGRRGLIEYADDEAITSNVVGITFDTLQHSALRASAVSGSVVTIDPASEPVDAWREGELAGRLLLITAGVGATNHVHLIDRHHYDGTSHYVVLATGGQFAPALIPAGATMSVCARSAWLDYGQTVAKRYARLTFGLAADEAWDGHWACGNWVPGVARYFDPPLAWSHTDVEEPNTVVQRARNGQTWAYEEGPAERVWTGRQIGDTRADRVALRDLLRVLAKYQEEPVALLLNENSTEDQNRHLLLARWEGGSHLDQQAWTHASPSTISRGAGDQDVQFREIV